MYVWDETWDKCDAESVETKLYGLCNHGKNVYFHLWGQNMREINQTA
jgi:hypothetical protein